MAGHDAAGPAGRPTLEGGERGISRRSVLRGSLLVGAGAVGGGLLGGLATAAARGGGESTAEGTEAFYGAHQAGIITDTQRQTVLAAFDLTTDDRADVAALLQAWTALGAELAGGDSALVPRYTGSGADDDAYADVTGTATADDSLEAFGLGPARLTLTVGFGAGLFTSAGRDRYGLASQRPPALVDLPRFPGDELDVTHSGGDLYLQACADDPQVAFHAVRSIARIAPDVATLRWTQVGYSPSGDRGTPRNLMGFKDGTVNSNAHPPADLDATVWAGSEGPAWMEGGSYLVYRRIRITLEHWDRLAANLQEQVVGRSKLTGAPLGATNEFDALDLAARTSDGSPVIPVDAHVRLAAPQSNGGAVMVRRAFSYNNGTTPFVERWPPWRQALEYDAGLLFLAYQKDPRQAFLPVFTKLAEVDAMNQFTTHTASATFAIPPGARRPGDWIGRRLFS